MSKEERPQPVVREGVLDGLRGLAVLLVVYYHYLHQTDYLPSPGSGYVGVLVFFVLSGYLITRILWKVEPTWGHYRSFLARRAQRLYPALLGLVVVGAPILSACGPETLEHDLKSAGLALLQLGAFVSVGEWHLMGGYEPTWSLTVEWTFYLLWPLAVLAMSRARLSAKRAAVVAGSSAAALYVVALPISARAFYFLPVANLGVMLVGATLALVHINRRDEGRTGGRDPGVATMGLLLLLIMTVVPGAGAATSAYRYFVMPIAVVAACVVLDQTPGTGGPARRLLGSRVLRAVGLASYSAYLWHVPVIWSVWFALPDTSPAIRGVLAVLILIPVVWLSFTLLEKPWLRLPGVAQSKPRENVDSRS